MTQAPAPDTVAHLASRHPELDVIGIRRTGDRSTLEVYSERARGPWRRLLRVPFEPGPRRPDRPGARGTPRKAALVTAPARRQHRALLRSAAGLSRELLLVCPAEAPPAAAWLERASRALEASGAACVGAPPDAGGTLGHRAAAGNATAVAEPPGRGDAEGAPIESGSAGATPVPTLVIEPSCMLVRRSALLASGGPDDRYMGLGDGLDFAWRLWSRGHEVFALAGASRPSPPTATPPTTTPPDIYHLCRNWVWAVARLADEGVVGLAVTRSLLAMMELAGRAVAARDVVVPPGNDAAPPRAYIEETPVLRPGPADRRAPAHAVAREVAGMLAAFHDISTEWLPKALGERPALQRRRCLSDAEIAAATGRDPADLAHAYFAALCLSALGLEGRSVGEE